MRARKRASGLAGEGHPGAGARARDALRRRLAHLMVGRLVLCVAILGVALLVTAQHGGEEAERGERGLYATLVLAFAATMGYAALLGRVRRVRAFGAAQVATDLAVATALVHFTGGVESIFAFLYVPITVYAALLLGRSGAYGASAAAALGYGLVAVLPRASWMPIGTSGAVPVELALLGVHAGALLLVALLASALSHERDRAGHALDERTRALRHLQRLHERTVESLTSGLLTTDSDGRITSFNPEAERITGRSAGEALGLALGEVIPGAPDVLQEGAAATGRGDRTRLRLRFQGPAGDDIHLGIAGSVLRSAEGEPAGHVVIFQDVTKVVEMEAELRRQERLAAVGSLSAHLAHEIRNPLAAISGSIQVLEGSLGGDGRDDETRRLLGIAVREADRLNQLITDFLQYARPAPGQAVPVAIAAVAAEVLEMFDSVCPETVVVTREIPSALCVLAEEGPLRQVLWNLFLNAVQAMPDGGSLHVAAAEVPAQAPAAGGRIPPEEGERWVEIEVADTGTGIPEEVLDRIFDPFFTTKKDGTGLGLATVHRVVEASAGHLAVESAVGRGTRFRIRLPRADRVSPPGQRT
jgi:two-component system sensor histidine kinase PilS (NtrC family)